MALYQQRYRLVDESSTKDFYDQSRFITQRIGQFNQILSTFVLVYRQVIEEKLRALHAENDLKTKEIGVKLATLLDSLRAKRSAVNSKQESYFKAADVLEKECVLIPMEPPKDRVKAFRAARMAAEEAYKGEYVSSPARVPSRMELLFQPVRTLLPDL